MAATEIVIQNTMDRIFTIHKPSVKNRQGTFVVKKVTIFPGACSEPVDMEEIKKIAASNKALQAYFDTGKLAALEREVPNMEKESLKRSSSAPEKPEHLKDTANAATEDGKIQHQARTEVTEVQVSASDLSKDAPAGGKK